MPDGGTEHKQIIDHELAYKHRHTLYICHVIYHTLINYQPCSAAPFCYTRNIQSLLLVVATVLHDEIHPNFHFLLRNIWGKKEKCQFLLDIYVGVRAKLTFVSLFFPSKEAALQSRPPTNHFFFKPHLLRKSSYSNIQTTSSPFFLCLRNLTAKLAWLRVPSGFQICHQRISFRKRPQKSSNIFSLPFSSFTKGLQCSYSLFWKAL